MNESSSIGVSVFAVPQTALLQNPGSLPPESTNAQFLYAVPHSWRHEQCGTPFIYGQTQ